jgi:hypothetical protein
MVEPVIPECLGSDARAWRKSLDGAVFKVSGKAFVE